MYVLDTNTIIYLIKGRRQTTERIIAVPPNEVAIPTIVLYELYVGTAKSQNPARRAQFIQSLVARSMLLSFSQSAATHAANIRVRLEEKGQIIGPIDILIAGIAMAHEATLITHNVREFARVDGLAVEDWF